MTKAFRRVWLPAVALGRQPRHSTTGRRLVTTHERDFGGRDRCPRPHPALLLGCRPRRLRPDDLRPLRPPLLRYAARLLDGDWHKAEDILQETTARAWKHAHYLGTRDRLVRPWLFTVVKNLVMDHHRSRRIRPLELMPTEELEASWETSETLLTLHVVLEALQELTEQQRTVIRLMYHLECSVAQAAAQGHCV
ncbi:sigma-70 family RNA polymerase sigma factor [Streptomyces sp. NPDC000348]|uniref:sigma-70 family RNA polymerase sigma factor n=1 Tax=Streptomyces sp. NPDC000348 TaxID=3364538 RepID=UPI00369ED4EC